MIKKNILIFSLVITLIFFSQFLFDSDSCGSNKLCNDIGDVLNQDNLTVVFIAPFFLFFSLLTYKMRDEVFNSWWRFARWFVPLIIVVTFLQNTAHQQSGFGGVAQGAFDFLIQIVLYVIFILVSLAKIFIAYRKKAA